MGVAKLESEHSCILRPKLILINASQYDLLAACLHRSIQSLQSLAMWTH